MTCVTTSDPIPGLIEPIRLSVRVRRGIDAAFDLFTREIVSWWPLDRFSFDTSRSAEVHIEPFVGGRFYERYSDGEEHTSGTVLKWNPPLEVVYTWAHHEWVAPTEVSVRFVAEDTQLTRVELEHRAWERLGVPAAESREMYANGWPTVLGLFAQAAGPA